MVKTAVLLLVLAVPACAQAHYRYHGKYALPDSKITPGGVDARLVADVSGKSHLVGGVEANVCAKDFRTGPWRKVSELEKKKACAEYGITSGCPGPKWELDHLISLEIGGNDSLGNLWPQPIGEARIKDHQVEDKLPKMVCSGVMTLKEAQECVSKDWVDCAVKIAGKTKGNYILNSLEGGK